MAIRQSRLLFYRTYDLLKSNYISTALSFFEQYPIFILPYELNSLFFSGERTQLDSSEVRRRLKLKGDLETECSSNRWWQVGDSGGWRCARDPVTHGVAPRMLIASRNPRRLYLDDSHTSRHTHSRTDACMLTARGNMWTYFLSNARSFRRISLPLAGPSLRFSMEIPVGLLLEKVSDTRCGLDILS